MTTDRLDDTNLIDPPTEKNSDAGGPCVNCDEPLAKHTTATNVENESVTFCPDMQEFRDVGEATEAITRIVRETCKRVGGIRRDGTLPAHFGDDILVALWKVFGHEDLVYVEAEGDDEDDEYVARGGHFKGCGGENCVC